MPTEGEPVEIPRNLIAVAYNSRITPDPTDRWVSCSDCTRPLVQSSHERYNFIAFQREQGRTLPLLCANCAIHRFSLCRDREQLAWFGPSRLVDAIMKQLGVIKR